MAYCYSLKTVVDSLKKKKKKALGSKKTTSGKQNGI